MNTPNPQFPSENPAYGPERLSVAAALSLLLALVAVGGCVGLSAMAVSSPDRLLYIVASPALAAIAVVLGIVARRRIARSGGTLRGRGLATMGIFVGVLASIIPTAFILAALVTLSSLKMLAPVTERLALAAASQRPDIARAELSPACSGEVSDERLLALAEAIERAAGKPAKADVSLGAVIEARSRVQASAGAADPAALGELSPKPVVIRCARDSVIAYIIIDEDAIQKDTVRIDDALFLMPDGSSVTLRPDGPARDVARALGVAPMELPG